MIRFVLNNARWLSSGLALTFTSSFGQTYFISIFAAQIMAHYNLTDGEWGQLYAIGTGLHAVPELLMQQQALPLAPPEIGRALLKTLYSQKSTQWTGAEGG